MAKINIRFACGCQKPIKDIAEAAKHVDETSHSLQILGTIVPTSKPEKK